MQSRKMQPAYSSTLVGDASQDHQQQTWTCRALRVAKRLELAARCATFMASLAARPLPPNSLASALLPVWYASVACPAAFEEQGLRAVCFWTESCVY